MRLRLFLVLGFLAVLAVEEIRIARSRTALADERGRVAELVQAQALAAAGVARATAEAAMNAQAELDRQLESERELRRQLGELERTATETRTAADRQIARLKRENETLAAWAATRIPGPWVAFMRGELPDGGP